MSLLVPDPAWLATLHASADRPPRAPRVPLRAGAAVIGSVEPEFLSRLGALSQPAAGVLARTTEGGACTAWHVTGDLTASLGRLARAMRDAGLSHSWRDEQLAVHDQEGNRLGTIERAVVHPLGITTRAVHLVGFSPDGRHWMQRRSMTKSNDPGMWDTLVGGMVSASDSVHQALERETLEEAGLRLDQLSGVGPGGAVATRRPVPDGGGTGYVIEHIDWYRGVLPHGVVPQNQDGEVDEFRLMTPAEVLARLERNEFTLEAALILCAAKL